MPPSGRGSARPRREDRRTTRSRRSAERGSRCRCRAGRSRRASAQTALSRRRTVLRTTAEPTCRLTMKPKRGGALVTGGVHVGHRVRCGAPTTPTDDGLVLRSAGESVRPRQHRSGSGRELGAPLGATSREDAAAGAGAHAGAETVLLGATAVVGLEGALAHGITSGSRCHRDAQTGDAGTGDCREGISQPIKATSYRPDNSNRAREPALSPIRSRSPGNDTRAGSTVEFAPGTPAD